MVRSPDSEYEKDGVVFSFSIGVPMGSVGSPLGLPPSPFAKRIRLVQIRQSVYVSSFKPIQLDPINSAPLLILDNRPFVIIPK